MLTDWDKAIEIDADSEPIYGHDQAFVSCPVVFPTVTIGILPTDGLRALAEKDGRYSPDADFCIGLNGFTESRVDSCITIICEDGEGHIDLSEEEQAEVWNILDRKCRKAFGQGCEQLLERAEALIQKL